MDNYYYVIMRAKKWRNYNSCRCDWVINANKFLTCILPFSHSNALRMRRIALYRAIRARTTYIIITLHLKVSLHIVLFSFCFFIQYITIWFVFFATSYSFDLSLSLCRCTKMFSARLIFQSLNVLNNRTN